MVKAALVLLDHLLQALTESASPSEPEIAGMGKVLNYIIALIPNQT